jgi:hypothetical protein
MLASGDELSAPGQWQVCPSQSSTDVSPGDFVCRACMAISSRAPCIICNGAPEDDDHHLLTGFCSHHLLTPGARQRLKQRIDA